MKTEEKEVELLPCPWCNFPKAYLTTNGVDEYFCECFSCGASGPCEDTDTEAIAKWNTRAPVSQWISVEDRLPPPLDEVFVCEHGIYVRAGYYSAARKEWLDHDDKILTVTHWQPLPLPPELAPKHTFQIVMPGSDKPIEAK